MKGLLTKRLGMSLSLLLTMVVFMSFSLINEGLLAQIRFEITSPASVAGSYEIGTANYGSVPLDPIAGELEMSDPEIACSPVADLTGKVALSDRADCSFSLKAFHAQKAGAVFAIMCNTEETTINMAAGDSADLVTIPHISLANSDCERIKVAMATEAVSANLYFANWDIDSVVWGDEADGGDFSQHYMDLGWTSTSTTHDSAFWDWGAPAVTDGSCGTFSINSPTNLNGAVFFDGDGFLSGGSEFDCGTNAGEVQSELISPVIDLTDAPFVGLRFWQFNLPVDLEENLDGAETAVSFSTDGGATWSDPIAVPTTSEQNTAGAQYSNPERIFLFLDGAGGSDNFRFKFTYHRQRLGFYNWMIDDVALVLPPENDAVMTDAFYPPINFATPEQHIGTDTFGFSTIIRNAGSNEDAPFTATVQILDADENVMMEQSDSRNLSRFTNETVEFDLRSIDYGRGEYTIRYSVAIDGETDEFPDNNEIEFPFVLTEETFAKEWQDGQLTNFQTNTQEDVDWTWSFGNFYLISSEASAECRPFSGVELALSAEDGSLDDEALILQLFKWTDNNNGYPDNDELLLDDGTSILSHPNLTPEALAIVTDFDGVEPGQLFTAPLTMDESVWMDVESNPLTSFELEAGATYLVLAEFNQSELSIAVGPEPQPHPVIGSVLFNYQGTNDYFNTINGQLPVIRMLVPCLSASNDVELPDHSVALYPNPTKDFMTLSLDFEESTDTWMYITNSLGQVMRYVRLGDFAQFEDQIDVSKYATGNYYLHIETNEGQKTVKFQVQE